jgi:uncharacterized membrane protein YczE
MIALLFFAFYMGDVKYAHAGIASIRLSGLGVFTFHAASCFSMLSQVSGLELGWAPIYMGDVEHGNAGIASMGATGDKLA